MIEKKSHTKGIGDILDHHRKELHEKFSQILSTIEKVKTPDPEAPTFAITTRSRVSTQDPPFPAPLRSTSENLTKGESEKEGLDNAEPSAIQEPTLQPSIFYQPSKSSNLPFLSRLKKQKKDDEDERLLSIFKQIHINLPFLEAMIHMPKRAKVLKDLLSHNEKLEKVASSVKLSEECFTVIQRSLPQKEGDTGSFTLLCLIGHLAVKNALADLGFIFPVDFVVLEMDEDELVPIILGRPFLATARAIIDVYEGKLSLRVESQTVTFNIGKSMKSKHSQDSNEALAVSFYSRVEPVEPLEWKTPKNQLKPSSVEPPKLELKELPEHLEYAFLHENNQLPAVISFALSTTEKAKLLLVLKDHKVAIAWNIADIKRIDSSFCTHKILMEDEFKPSVQPQRRLNPNIKEVVKKEVIKLLDTGLIYLISDSPWVSPIQVVPKKGE
ncbi:DNA-directed DNA polymerase [Tanacetum coccineum]|uniref:DNA-directed DNA polymerase n=1 Tax=Tanacetum coccineum TaxID=301880 RepID=A0ABQ5FAU5_9ASTR